ncbi:uncharacterized protein E5676_scaffold70G00060 [Cucumis melo var. makuwa]|uniref:Gag protease polyprotein n=1 Tax=Cucumis melo var. makuwa TaxID=1194695 RepID=A0A5D3C5F9_CUCMM|nr:uncharacterized protein E5676_scaffold70G00060 [Cucumis melo var. makuwa]
MSLRRDASRSGLRGRGAGSNHPKGQPAMQVVDPVELVTHADLVLMEQRLKDMLTEALAKF